MGVWISLRRFVGSWGREIPTGGGGFGSDLRPTCGGDFLAADLGGLFGEALHVGPDFG